MVQISDRKSFSDVLPKDAAGVDFRAVFEQSPALQLLLDPFFVIVAVSDAYAAATMTKREEIVGKHLFEVFPDNPDDDNADGVLNLRSSLLQVMRTRAAHEMAVQRYDIRTHQTDSEEFEVR